MFVSDRFVFLELHKTGCTHIRSVLQDVLGGGLYGKHNQATASLFDGRKHFLGSVRNPWEWYLSLWAYGCDNKGAVYHNVTRSSVRGLGLRRSPVSAFLRLFVIYTRSPRKWLETYADINDPEGFREWLRMLHDPRFFVDVREGYSECPINRLAGLMTFRYLKLFCEKRATNIIIRISRASRASMHMNVRIALSTTLSETRLWKRICSQASRHMALRSRGTLRRRCCRGQEQIRRQMSVTPHSITIVSRAKLSPKESA